MLPCTKKDMRRATGPSNDVCSCDMENGIGRDGETRDECVPDRERDSFVCAVRRECARNSGSSAENCGDTQRQRAFRKRVHGILRCVRDDLRSRSVTAIRGNRSFAGRRRIRHRSGNRVRRIVREILFDIREFRHQLRRID